MVGINFSTLAVHGCTVVASCSGHICEELRRGEPGGVPVCIVLQCQARGISGFVDGSGWEVSARLAWISHIARVDGHLFLGGCFFFSIFSLTLGFAKTSWPVGWSVFFAFVIFVYFVSPRSFKVF